MYTLLLTYIHQINNRLSACLGPFRLSNNMHGRIQFIMVVDNLRNSKPKSNIISVGESMVFIMNRLLLGTTDRNLKRNDYCLNYGQLRGFNLT